MILNFQQNQISIVLISNPTKVLLVLFVMVLSVTLVVVATPHASAQGTSATHISSPIIKTRTQTETRLPTPTPILPRTSTTRSSVRVVVSPKLPQPTTRGTLPQPSTQTQTQTPLTQVTGVSVSQRTSPQIS